MIMHGVPASLSPSSTVIVAFGGQAVDHNGTYVLKLAYQGSCKPRPFHVVDVDGPTILGLSTCTDLNLVIPNFGITTQKASKLSPTPKPICDPDPVAKDEPLREYGDCFQGEFHITVDPTVPLIVHPPCRVPEALKEPLKKELDSLVDQGILVKVAEPTDWVNSLVCLSKGTGALRLCLDPKDLNEAALLQTYALKMFSRSLMVQNVSQSWMHAVGTGTLG